jgi:hypothetical protein
VVVLGESNENDVIVEQGLSKGDRLYLTTPEDADKFKLRGEDLIEIVRERRQLKAEEEKRTQNINPREGMRPDMTPEQMREFLQNLTPEQREAMRQSRGAAAPGMGQGRQPGGTRPDTAVRQQVVIRKQ